MSFLGAVERHFGCVSSFGDHSISRFGQIMHDVRLLMLRISFQETLWDDAGGGSLSSNLKLLPYQLQLASFLVEQGGSGEIDVEHVHYRSILDKNSGPSGSSTGATGTDESAPFIMVLGLLFWSGEEWEQRKVPLLLRALRQSLRDAKKGTGAGSGAATATRKRSRSNSFSSPVSSSSSSSSSTSASGSEKRQKRSDDASTENDDREGEHEDPSLSICRPILRFACIIDSIHQHLKKRTAPGGATVASSATKTSSVSSSAAAAASSSSSSSAAVAAAAGAVAAANPASKHSNNLDSGMNHDDQAILDWCEDFVPLLEGELATGQIASYTRTLRLSETAIKDIDKCLSVGTGDI
jgi:hypothetical protein